MTTAFTSAVDAGAARRVGIVGAGVIGGGWALHYLRTGFDVDVYDPSPTAPADLLRMVEASWPVLERMGLREGASPDRLTCHDTMAAAVADADLVQENAPENGPDRHAATSRWRGRTTPSPGTGRNWPTWSSAG